MTVPAYTNVAHFRAPYKNSYVYTGVGQNDVPVAPPVVVVPTWPGGQTPAEKELLAKHLTVGKNGELRWNKETAFTLRTVLQGYATATFPSPSDDPSSGQGAELWPFTPEEFAAAKTSATAAAMLKTRSGATWVEQRAAEGNVVFASVGLLVPGAGPKMLAALDPSDTERITLASVAMPILAGPGVVTPLSKASIFANPVALGVGAVLVGGVGIAIYQGFKSQRRLPRI